LISQQWVQRCRRADESFNPSTAVICSVHFTPENYERDLRAELLNLLPKKILKPHAVPSNKLDNDAVNKNALQSVNDRKNRVKKGNKIGAKQNCRWKKSDHR
jgi:hypothetical protein